MNGIPSNLRRIVLERSGNRCEYCHLSQVGQEATFHIDHITPVSAGGETISDNLALACVSCSLRKGARQAAVDSVTQLEVSLFNPRRDSWSEHFRWEGARLESLTAIGRCTINALSMNRPLILDIRSEEIALKRHPS